MPTVRYTGGGGYRIRGGPEWAAAGDEAAVDEDTAARLTDRPDFERVDDAERSDADGDGDEATFDADEWLDRDYRERAERVMIGEVDDQLDRIEEVETSETVRDAVADRRDELET